MAIPSGFFRPGIPADAPENLLLIQRDTGLDSGQFTVEASVVTFLDQFPFQTRGGNFQRVRKRNQIFNIEDRSYLFTDQLAIAMGNPG